MTAVRHTFSSLPLRYGVAIFSTGLAALLSYLLAPFLEGTPTVLFVAAVALSAWQGGFGPGLIATALGAIVFNALFVPTQLSAGLQSLPAVLYLSGFLGVDILITLLLAFLRRDVARWRRAEAALHAAYDDVRATQAEVARLAAIIEVTPDLVAIADADGRRVYLNPAGRKLLGIDPTADISINRLEEDRPSWAREQYLTEILPIAQAQGSWNGESAYRSADGREVPVLEVVLVHRSPDGTLTHYSTMARDITNRKQVEQEVERRSQELASANLMLHQRATTDTLTGLANRDHALELLDRLISIARREQRTLAFAFLDIDHFKQVNDRFGHQVGDQVLHQLGVLLGASFRGEDVVARWGGEEFLVGLFGTDKAHAAERLVGVLADFRDYPFAAPNGTAFHVSCSAGVAEYPGDGTDSTTLHLAADQALYQAKAAGRDRVVSAEGSERSHSS
jgi:diguanylate cyclase (GGDEF)-like protein/PAS domain S-box-containing protein